MQSLSFTKSRVMMKSYESKSGPLRDIARRVSQSIASRLTIAVESKPSSGKAGGRYGLDQRSRWANWKLSEPNAASGHCKPFSTNAACQINSSLGNAHIVQKMYSSTRNGLGSTKLTEIAF